MGDSGGNNVAANMSQLQVHDSMNKMIIGLDFGTTYSGIAYAFKDQAKPELTSILDWPGAESDKLPKVPTLISYDPKNPTSFTWGAQNHKHGVIEGVKLLLDMEQEKPFYVPMTNTKAELKKLGKPPVDVAADYIEALFKHAMSRIETKVPLSYLNSDIQRKYVMSVPAVWSDKAKDATLKAAKMAGIYPVTLIKEPEAAAMYTLHVLQDRGLGEGDAIVICDAGGGTVDLISYEIETIKPVLQMKELVPSKGGMAGSLQLNKRFEEHVKLLVGEDQYYHLRKTRAYTEAVKFFDRTVKPAFRGDQEESWMVNFPMAELEDDPAQNLKRNTWEMKSEVVESIFKPLISHISQLVDDQINLVINQRLSDGHPKAKEIKAIFLVGGFGASEYLKQCLAKQHPDIQIIQPHDAWSAIVKGAVLSQLPMEAIVTSTKARSHYGVAAFDLFDDVQDAGEQRTKDPSTGRWRCQKMTWYIEKNEDLKRDQRIRFPFYRSLHEGFGDHELMFTDELIMDDSVKPSKYPKDGVTKVNCTLTADLRSMDRSLLQKRVGIDGRTYMDVHYDLCVAVQSAIMKFSLEIKGKEMGSVEAEYS